jgi:hypothetical protein
MFFMGLFISVYLSYLFIIFSHASFNLNQFQNRSLIKSTPQASFYLVASPFSLFTLFTDMFLPNEPFKPPTSPPPPINWATKPGRATETVTTETVIQTTDGRRLVPIFIDLDHLSEFGQAVFRQIKQLEAETVSYDGSLSNPSNLSSTSGDISASLSQLSITETLSTTSLASVPLRLGATTPTMPISGSQSSPSKLTSGDSPQAIKKRKRYYVVTVGKCAGVFFDEWYAYFHSFV